MLRHCYSGSNVLIHLATRYPDWKFVCLDSLEYCATVNNFQELNDRDNFKFVRVRPASGSTPPTAHIAALPALRRAALCALLDARGGGGIGRM